MPSPALFYKRADNTFAAFVSSDGATVLADEKLSVIRDAETGAIRQIGNYWDGLADVVPATDGNGYTIALYLPIQITASGAVVDLRTDTYTYTELNGLRRVECSNPSPRVP